MYLQEGREELLGLQVLELYIGYTLSSRRSSDFHTHCNEINDR